MDPINRPHSPEFADRWRALLRELYGYREQEQWLLVPGIAGGATYSYLPLLNYTNLTPEEAREKAAALPGNRPYQIRVLDPEKGDFQEGDPVTMRLLLDGREYQRVWDESIHSKCRNQVRKAQKSGLRLEIGTEEALVRDFYRLFLETMERYGTPAFSRELFRLLPAHCRARYFLAYAGERPAAALVMVEDGPIAWVPWAASDPDFKKECPNHLIYSEAIAAAAREGKEVFDFGRSPFGEATYKFKRQWGAEPVGLAILSPKEEDLYAKYGLASALWKRLPSFLTRRLGPVLCKRLADL